MVLLDTVGEYSPTSLVATKAITGSESCYRDLADSTPLAGFAYPQALMVESFGQACSLLWTLAGLGPPDRIPLLVGVSDLVFHSPSLPGDVLEHQVRLVHSSETACEFTGRSHVNGDTVLSVRSLLVASLPGPSPT
ncbi:3-hydroxyacyl-ACP dehydratase FabZ family protein [Streptomyces sp. NBC_00878]|uniref:3-hydroxyacyl-ACP dehydratase FabZ family protein n=1 Tax=Streptomyces sp. NBC_00878 TaxID=2975854 RepID=UPI002254D8C0|nr:beta-hydroxyacyl-ACP dehydratase [Streptomyces sp. NBC_00878]MCX4904345.1 beta-hydroxyacyl-ACP dehydratase [Streptomyces sp. NBC_00878]